MTEYTAPLQLVVDVEKLLDQVGWNDYERDIDGDPVQTTRPANLRNGLATEVARILAGHLLGDMRSVVRDAVTEEARAQVAPIIDEVMTTGFRKTNSYGEAVGEMITVRELVIEQVKHQLERKVTRNGNTATGYDRDARTYIQHVAHEAANAALNGELKAATTAAVDEVQAKVKDLVADQLGAQITRAVSRI